MIRKFFAALVLMVLGALPATAQQVPVVSTASGRLAGVVQGGSHAYLGIPYAQPPMGDLRWRAPVKPAAWQGVRDGSKFGANCYQAPPGMFGPYTPEYLIELPVSEDCLYLNVWTPAVRSGALPVLVFIHGGGFSSGSGSIPIYNGAALTAHGAVVVNLNYRLGVFGFLAHPELSAESDRRISGNYALLDMIAALRWVRENISAFGGDPARVAIAGQSAGAFAVNNLTMSPDAKGLFSAAIAQSGSGAGVRAGTLAEAERDGVEYARLAGAGSVSALRGLSAEAVLAAVPRATPNVGGPRVQPRIQFRPVVDGKVLTADPQDPAARLVNNVPLMTGFNTDEGTAPGMHQTPAQFMQAVKDRYQLFADRLLALYPHGTDAEATASAALMTRDRYMAGLVIWSERRTQAAGQSVYTYLFDHAVPTASGPGWGSFHTAEVPYVFGALDPRHRPYTDADRKVAEQLGRYWINFAAKRDPNGADAPKWAPVTPGTGTVMGLGDHVGPRPGVSSAERLAVYRDYVASGGTLSLF